MPLTMSVEFVGLLAPAGGPEHRARAAPVAGRLGDDHPRAAFLRPQVPA